MLQVVIEREAQNPGEKWLLLVLWAGQCLLGRVSISLWQKAISKMRSPLHSFWHLNWSFRSTMDCSVLSRNFWSPSKVHCCTVYADTWYCRSGHWSVIFIQTMSCICGQGSHNISVYGIGSRIYQSGETVARILPAVSGNALPNWGIFVLFLWRDQAHLWDGFMPQADWDPTAQYSKDAFKRVTNLGIWFGHALMIIYVIVNL